jgi:mannose-6-phosphate isomerase-like protein (cupin superfamily)
MKSDHKFVSKDWGYEIWVENNNLYCCKHLRVMPGKWCSFHYHKDKMETFYVIGGELLLLRAPYNEDLAQQIRDANDPRWDWKHNYTTKGSIYHRFTTTILKRGESLTIKPHVLHTFTAHTSEPCDFIEASTQHKDSDSHRVVK